MALTLDDVIRDYKSEVALADDHARFIAGCEDNLRAWRNQLDELRRDLNQRLGECDFNFGSPEFNPTNNSVAAHLTMAAKKTKPPFKADCELTLRVCRLSGKVQVFRARLGSSERFGAWETPASSSFPHEPIKQLLLSFAAHCLGTAQLREKRKEWEAARA